MKKFCFILLFIITGGICLNAKVYVSPSYNELLISKEKISKTKTKRYVTHYIVGNTADKKVKIIVRLNAKSSKFIGKKSTEQLSVSDWLKFEGENKFVLGPKEKKKITFYVISPQDDYSEVSANLSFTIDDGGMIKTGITVPLYVIIKENAKAKARIKSFELMTNQKGDSVNKIKIIFKNDSNVHLRPEAKLIIKDKSNKTVKEINLGVLAPTSKTGDVFFSKDVDIKLDEGKYTAELVMKYFFNKKETRKKIKFKVNKKGRYIFIKK